MKLFHYLPVGACAAAAALLLASCGVSKRSLKQSNRALTAALQASAQKEQAEALKLYSDTSIPQGEARKSVSRDNPGHEHAEHADGRRLARVAIIHFCVHFPPKTV